MSCSVCFAEPKRFSSSRVIAESLDPVALYRDTVADAGAPAAADWSVHRRGGSVAIECDAMPRDAWALARARQQRVPLVGAADPCAEIPLPL